MTKRTARDGVFQRKDTAGWYASFVDSNGVRRRKRIEASTRPQALTALSLLKARVQKEEITGVKHTSEMSTADLLTRYKRYQKSRLSPTSFVRLESVLRTLNASLPLRLKDITKAKVVDFVSTRSLAVAPGSVQKEVTALKHALRLAVDWELIHTNPASRVQLPRLPEGRTRYLSPTELKSVLEAAPDWMRPPIALAAFTGMRRGELLSLRWKDVDLAGRLIYLPKTKNGSLRVLAINHIAMSVIDSLPQGAMSDLILPDVDKDQLSVYTKRLFESLKIEGASFHSLRHTAASWLVMEGVGLYTVGQILGHKTPRMTQRYAHLSPQYMAGAVGKLDTVFEGVYLDAKGGTPTGLKMLQTGAKPN